MVLVNNDTCLELEDDYGLRLSGRSSTIEIETELWNDFSIEFIDQKLKDYVKMPKEVTIVNDDLSFKRLGNDQLKLFKLHQRNHIVNSYNELDRKDIEYKLLENKFIKLREAKRSLKISNTRLRKSNEAKGNSLQEHQKKSNNQKEDLIQLTIFAERIISTLSTHNHTKHNTCNKSQPRLEKSKHSRDNKQRNCQSNQHKILNHQH